MAVQNPPVPEEKLGVPSRNPLPLSASQEAQARPPPPPASPPKLQLQHHTTNNPPAFAACALGRTFTVSFACRPEHRSMNSCMKLHATQSAHDEAREEWFALRIERQRERERKARVAQAQEEFMREWWGLPEHVRLSRQKEMEKRGERIHGLTAKDRPRGEGQ
ncbi:cytochrome c oxidase biogenesis [Fusarium mexicanum]|uniref:COX assembly mitochondrial protein n=1 Tax=Fusarium mexicanum TaxID=751941 RepID=A0A8H5J232_9HYPO|nr:cytochrome c oxidase biogenesis [Fusarium mexicanum]